MPIPPIPNKYSSQHISQIDVKNPNEVFTFFVRKLYFTGRWNEALMFLQLSQLVFKEKNSDLMRTVSHSYKNYFTNGTKKRLLIEKVYEEHPYIWDEEGIKPKSFSIAKLIDAVNDEISEVLRANRNLFLPLDNIECITERKNLKIYSATVITKSDEFVSLDEGVMVTITSSTGTKYRVTVLDYIKKSELVVFQTTQELDFKEGKIKVSKASVLFSLKKTLEEINLEGQPIKKLLYEQVPERIVWQGNAYTSGLSEVQINAINHVLSHNVTFIWGPPGTGKSYTLSRLLVSLYMSGEKTLVSSTANVAIDGLLEKTSTVLDNIYFRDRKDLASERRMLRIGYSQSDKVRSNYMFQINNETIAELNYKLQFVNEKIESLKEIDDPGRIGKLKSQRDELKQKLDDENKKMISSALMIFATSAKIISDDALKSFDYDNIVIDEGSMMSLPYLIVMAAKVKKRIIITGDFMQLGPIANSRSLKAERWLRSDLFECLGEKPETIVKHKALFMLNEQRRMAQPIAELINEPFYQGNLLTIGNIGQFTAKDMPPKQGHIAFIDTGKSIENKADIDPNSKSKYNKYSRKIVHSLLREILDTNSKSIKNIGVIAPYKQQIIDYKNESEAYQNKYVEVIFGTIHTFQGSECDIIIWDIVDTLQDPIGSLYKERTGERLVNVAISRAKSKLIIVGQHRLFHEGKQIDLVSSKVKKVLQKSWESYLYNCLNPEHHKP